MCKLLANFDARRHLPRLSRWRAWLPRAVAVGLAAYYLCFFLAQGDAGTGLTKFIYFGADFEARSLPALRSVPHYVWPGSGYDGQFYAEMALDPTLRDPALAAALDNPRYRERRVLFPWLAHLLGLGRPAWVLNAYVLQYLFFWVATGWLLTRWIALDSWVNLARWCGCMFACGMLEAMNRAVTESATMFFVLLALLFLEKHKDWPAVATLAIGAFGRETNILGAVIFGPPANRGGKAWAMRGLQVACVVIPLAAWMVYLSEYVSGGNTWGVHNFSLPGSGFATKLAADLNAGLLNPHSHLTYKNLIQLFVLVFKVSYLGLYRDWRDPFWRLGATYSLFAFFLGYAVWEGYPGAYLRVLIPLAFAYNLRLPSNWRGGVLALIGNFDVLAILIWST